MDVEKIHGRGNHLIIDGFDCNSEKLGDNDLIREVLNRIVEMLEMKKLNEPVVVKVEPIGTDTGGVTGMVLISQSHISIHTYPKKQWFTMDVFSCKEFDVEKVCDCIENTFESQRIEKQLLHRGDYEIEDLGLEEIKGFDPFGDISVEELVKRMRTIGFQATHLSKASEIIKKMRKDNTTIFLSFTSNMVSSGLREIFASLVKNKMIDVIITSVGSIEEDLIKCKKPFLLGSFDISDTELHRKGVNRIGNVFVPNDRYVHLENVLQPFFSDMLKIQKEKGKMLSPSEIIYELGKIVEDENSILYWATKNKIPIFCPGITDGAFGLQIFFFKQEHPEFGIDVTADMKELSNIVLSAKKTGAIILGGGIAKHHTIGINLVRDGLDYAVYVSTGTEYDGSLSGARVREGISWGKIKENANHVFVEGDATIIFPLLAISMRESE